MDKKVHGDCFQRQFNAKYVIESKLLIKTSFMFDGFGQSVYD